VSPAFSARQRTVYELMLRAYDASVRALGPGVPNRDVHFAAARVIFEGMKDLGIMKGDTEEALAAARTALVFPHGIGHMMAGSTWHDMENLGGAVRRLTARGRCGASSSGSSRCGWRDRWSPGSC